MPIEVPAEGIVAAPAPITKKLSKTSYKILPSVIFIFILLTF